jgi:predicted ATP-grasp superfamily ATP-dependent carboligase
VLGGAHGALAVIRSLGRRGVPVVFVTNDHPLPKLSRYVRRSFDWAGADAPDAVGRLIALAQQHGLRDWLLVPCADAEVRMIAENRDLLRQTFRIVSLDWNTLRSVCDKNELARLAAATGIPFPRSYRIGSVAEIAREDIRFPVVLKPAMRLVSNRFTKDKAWRADSAEQLKTLYHEATEAVGQADVVVQEYIPGSGEAQFSYAAFWHLGQPVAELTARRARQYPIEFSFTSTFVEVVDEPDVQFAARKLLAAISFEGLVEIEFKHDAREGAYKVLDVNPRPWTWLGLCAFAGRDLVVLMRDAAIGRKPIPESSKIESGRAWVHATRDFVAAAQLMRRGDLRLSAYLSSLGQKLTYSSFAWDDPLPGILELPLVASRVLKRFAHKALNRSELNKAIHSG